MSNVNDLLIQLKNQIEHDKTYYENKIKELEEDIKELSDPLIKDKMIEKLTKERCEALEDLHRDFGITKEENEQIRTWCRKHIDEKHNGNSYAGAIGGRYSFEFRPTSIGVVGTIKCTCGEEFTFQRYIGGKASSMTALKPDFRTS